MLAASDNIDDHIKSEYLLPNVHSKIEFTSDSMFAAHDSIEDPMKKMH